MKNIPVFSLKKLTSMDFILEILYLWPDIQVFFMNKLILLI